MITYLACVCICVSSDKNSDWGYCLKNNNKNNPKHSDPRRGGGGTLLPLTQHVE